MSLTLLDSVTDIYCSDLASEKIVTHFSESHVSQQQYTTIDRLKKEFHHLYQYV